MKVPQPFDMPFPAQANELGRFKRPAKPVEALVDHLLDQSSAAMRTLLGEEYSRKRPAHPSRSGS